MKYFLVFVIGLCTFAEVAAQISYESQAMVAGKNRESSSLRRISIQGSGQNPKSPAFTIQFEDGLSSSPTPAQSHRPPSPFGVGVDDNNRGRQVHFPSSKTERPVRCTDINGRTGICQEYIKCAMFQPEFIRVQKNRSNIKCQLADGKPGICCDSVLKNKEIDVESTFVKKPKNMDNDFDFRFGATSMQNSIRQAAEALDNIGNQHSLAEQRLLTTGDGNGASIIKKGSSSHGHLLFFQTSPKAIEISKFGYNLLQSSRDIFQRLGIQGKDGGLGLQKYNLQASSQKSKCPTTPTCDPKYLNYRTIDGSCNNLRVPGIGATFTPLLRIMEPEYSDGVWLPRISKGKASLPGARLLSESLIRDQDSPDSHFSLFVMQFGQFIDHDLSHVPIYRFSNGSGIQCCGEDGRFALPPQSTHPFCLPIEIPPNDSFYRGHRQGCMNFVRSMIAPRLDCSFGYGDQMNQITHWLDSSNVYSSTAEDGQELRLFQNGKLKTSKLPGGNGSSKKDMLPIQENDQDECTFPELGLHCFSAGDLRVNEMIGLTATHLVWLREHNRLAAELKLLNPTWNDDELCLQARRILNAEYQHILYNEWLPILVGRTYMEAYGILPLTNGYAHDYDNRIDPSISNAFSAAAFRVGHTLIQGILQLINDLGVVEEQLLIHEHFNSPFRIREEGLLDKILRALTTEPIQSFDSLVTSEVTQRLFQPRNQPFGMDLIALNIQRGRDHGIPGYNHYREICQIGRVESFNGFRDWIPLNFVKLLIKHYNHVDDVDLFIGGVLEKPVPGALLGPTFTCIIGDQFARSKKGDRFAYDLGGQESSFLPAQLDQIRHISFARIICDNSDRLQKIQSYAFFLPNAEFNQLVHCDGDRIPKLNLSHWKD